MLLLSKCVAGGFSAALILLWWPLIAPGDSLSAWLGRGVAFTLSFELLLLSLRPLEHALWATHAGTRLSDRMTGLAERISRGDTIRRLGSTATLAAIAVAVPVALIVAGLQERPKDGSERKARAVRVVRITKVVRPTTVRRVVAASEAPAPAAAAKATQVAQPKAVRSKPRHRARTGAPRSVERPASKGEPEQAPADELATPGATSGKQESSSEAPSRRPASGSSTGAQPELNAATA